MTQRQATGQIGEALAARFLEQKGLRIVERNWRCRDGEIDLVAKDGDCLAMVEVRTRRGQRFGRPEESLSIAKQGRMRRSAMRYLQASEWQGPWRIDLVAVELAQSGSPERIEHYEWAI